MQARVRDNFDKLQRDIEARSEHEKFLLQQDVKKLEEEVEAVRNDKNDQFAPRIAEIKQLEDDMDKKRCSFCLVVSYDARKGASPVFLLAH